MNRSDAEPNRLTTVSQRVVPPLLAAVLMVGLWSLAIQIWDIKPYLVPKPSAVANKMWSERATLAGAFFRTGTAAVLGLTISLLVGTAVGIIFSQFRWLRFAFYPYAVFLQTVPVVAIAPLLVMWFGYGTKGIVAVSFVLSLFPIIANMTAGMMSVPSRQRDLFLLYRASRWQTLWKLEFPHALPDLATGLKTSSGLSVIGAIVGEFFVGYGEQGIGLGYLIRSSAEGLQSSSLFAAVLLSTLLGIFVFGSVSGLTSWLIQREG